MTHTRFSARTGMLLVAALASTTLLAAMPPPASHAPQATLTAAERAVAAQYAALPMRFEPNVGQADPQVQYLARGNGYTMFLTLSESVIVLSQRPISANDPPQAAEVVRMHFAGANAQPDVVGLQALPGISNYFVGNDPDQWHTDIVSFAKVRYSQIYPGIDLVYYGSAGDIEYDFVVQPGSDPAAIRLSFEGTRGMSVNPAGELVLALSAGELRQKAPVMYQQGPDGATLVAGRYVLHGNQVGFEIGGYDHSRALVIDPVLVYSTYLGGSGLDQATSLVVGPTGDAYVAGMTSSTNFPIQGTPTSTNGGGQDLFVTKLSLTGASLTYSSYIGGIGTEVANDIAVSGAGTVYITGSTDSIDYPVVTPTIAAQVGGTDAFLTKLTSAGNAIEFSTYWGSTGFEEGTAVTVDPADNAYIAGNTSAPDFPTQTPFQAALAGGMDGFMTKFSVAGNSVVYSTYLGGAGDDRVFDMAVADDAAVFVVGSSTSANFPTTSGSVQPALAGARDGFVTHFSLAGNALLYSTFLGGAGSDEVFGMVIDAPMNAYVTGRTTSTNFPTLTPLQGSYGGGANDAFVAKINPSGAALVYSTYLGGAGDDKGQGIAIDGSRNAFVTGSTTSKNFPTLVPLQARLSGPSDAFVSKLNLTGSSLVYSSFLGGVSADEGFGIGVDLVGSAYVAGFTESSNFPIANPFQAAFGGLRDAFVSKLVDSSISDLIFADGFD
jgi:hypothetical protein